MDTEVITMLSEGKDILYTFKSEAEDFATRNGLTINYIEPDLIENAHYEVKGYTGKLYWIA